jgi:hypothetical protein
MPDDGKILLGDLINNYDLDPRVIKKRKEK